MKKGVFIEIAALVDVLLVILFLVMLQVTQTAEAAESKVADYSKDYESEIGRLQAENSSLERKVGTYAVFEENCLILTISVEYGDSNSRTALVEAADGQAERISLNWADMQYAKNALQSYLNQKIKDAFGSGDQMAFIVFQYDRDTIYQSDYSLISSVIQSQKSDPNVYSAEYDILGASKNGG